MRFLLAAQKGMIMKVAGVLLLVAVVLAVAGGLLWHLTRTGSDPELRIGHSALGRMEKSEAEWKQELTPEQFRVTRRAGTELAFSGAYHHSKDDGVYACVCCGQPLFDSQAKFDSGTGWPSYWQPIDVENVTLRSDNSFFGPRVEVVCSRCDAHLGHVFKDGPPPTGLRYCMNSVALRFEARAAKKEQDEK
jgi:peptide-methionine (R)-S-oxide reductase